MDLSLELFNPLFWHLLKYDNDPKVRTIKIKGGSSAGKTHTVAQYCAFDGYWRDYSTVVFRKEQSVIKDTIKKDFAEVIETVFDHELFRDAYKSLQFEYRSNRGDNLVRFKGLDKSEKAKGLKGFKKFVMDEMDAFDSDDDKEMRRRMRGMEGQKIIQMWNPVSPLHFLKGLIDRYDYDVMPNEIEELEMPEVYQKYGKVINLKGWSKLDDSSEVLKSKCGRHVVITTTYLDNKWITGGKVGDREYGREDEQVLLEFEEMKEHEPEDYLVYGLGKWGKIQNKQPWFNNFSRTRNVRSLEFNGDYPLILGMDFNVDRMALLVGQMIPDKQLNIIDRIKGIDTEDVCNKFIEKYGDVMFGIKVYLDASARNRSALKGAWTNYHEVREKLGLVGDKNAFKTRVNRKVNLEHGQSRKLVNYIMAYIPVFIDEKLIDLIEEIEKAEVVENPETGKQNLKKDDKEYTMDMVDAYRYLIENTIISINEAKAISLRIKGFHPEFYEEYRAAA